MSSQIAFPKGIIQIFGRAVGWGSSWGSSTGFGEEQPTGSACFRDFKQTEFACFSGHECHTTHTQRTKEPAEAGSSRRRRLPPFPVVGRRGKQFG